MRERVPFAGVVRCVVTRTRLGARRLGSENTNLRHAALPKSTSLFWGLRRMAVFVLTSICLFTGRDGSLKLDHISCSMNISSSPTMENATPVFFLSM